MRFDSEPMHFDFSDFETFFQYDRWLAYRHMIQYAFDQIFPNRVEQRQVYAVTGNGPFLEDDLLDLFERAGLYERESTDTVLSDLDSYGDFFDEYFMVVGREGFETDLLDWALEHLAYESNTLLVLSQEDFFINWMFGRYEPYTRNDPRVFDHPALRYLAEHSGPRWPWPSTTPEPSFGGEVDDNSWRKVHPLRGRFGYTVGAKEGLTDQERWRRLDRALTTPDDPLSLKEVVEHIAWQARWKKKDDAHYFENAIAKWERDLAYLKEKYYHRQFLWPKTD